MKDLLIRAGVGIPAVTLVIALMATVAHAESYRLIHAIGNSEREVAKGLSQSECKTKKKELIAIGEAIGTHNERLGIGSISCIPESFFND